MYKVSLQRLLDTLSKHDGSDLLIIVGSIPALRVDGRWRDLKTGGITESDMAGLVDQLRALSPRVFATECPGRMDYDGLEIRFFWDSTAASAILVSRMPSPPPEGAGIPATLKPKGPNAEGEN